MDLDWFIFPSPESSYFHDKVKVGQLIYIPKKNMKDMIQMNQQIMKKSIFHAYI